MEEIKSDTKSGNPVILTQEQKAKILGLINSNVTNPPSVKDILDNLFPDKKLDGRSFEGKAVKSIWQH